MVLTPALFELLDAAGKPVILTWPWKVLVLADVVYVKVELDFNCMVAVERVIMVAYINETVLGSGTVTASLTAL